LDALRIQAGIPGLAPPIIGPGSVSWEGAFGQQDVERNLNVTIDTPFEPDGTTQAGVGSLATPSAAHGRLNPDDPVAKFAPSSPDAGATLRQLLTHTSNGPNGLTFSYRPERLAPLAAALGTCTDSTFRWGLSNLVERPTIGMYSTVPGADVVQLTAP